MPDLFDQMWDEGGAAPVGGGGGDLFDRMWDQGTPIKPKVSPPIDARNEILGVRNRVIEGTGALLDFVEAAERNLNPLRFGGPRVFGLNENELNRPPTTPSSKLLQGGAETIGLYGPEKPQSALGQIFGEVGYYAPGALLPGGAIPSLAAGGAAGVTKAAGGSETAQAVAGLLGAFTPAAARTTLGRGYNALRNVFSPAAKMEEAKDAAKAVVQGLVDPQVVVDKIDDAQRVAEQVPVIQRQAKTYLPQYRRTAEVVGEPGAAALEETLRRVDPNFKTAATLQDALREEARQTIFSKANKNPFSQSQAGAAMRQGLEEGRTAAGGIVDTLAEKAFNRGEEIATRGAKTAVTGALNSFTKSGARQVSSEFDNLVQNFRALPPKVDMQTLQDYRSAFGKFAATGPNSTTQERMTAEIAGRLRSAIDTSVERAIEAGALPSSQAKAWRAMVAARAQKGALYESGGVADVLEKKPFNVGYEVPAEKVPGKLLSTKEDAQQFIKAAKANAQSIDAARSSILSRVWEKSTNAMTGEINPTTFHKQLSQISEIAPEVLTKNQTKALGIIADDLSSQATIKRQAFAASKAQSVTSESDSMLSVLQKSVSETGVSSVRNLVRQIPLLGNFIDAAWSIASNPEARRAAINQELARFAMDPQYAKIMLLRPSKQSIPFLRELTNRLSLSAAAGGQSIERLQSEPEAKAETPISSVFAPKERTRVPDNIKDVKAIESEIDQDPYYSAVYEAESGRNPSAKNPASSAAGGFQLINSTARNLGVSDVYDLRQNFEGMKKLTEQHKAAIGDDPMSLYSAHYLGIGLFKKWQAGKNLSAKEAAHVKYLTEKALPRFRRIYENVLAKREGTLV